MVTSSLVTELTSFPCKSFLIMCHRFLIGFKSGLMLGQSFIKDTMQSLSNWATDFAVWGGAPFFWNMLALVSAKGSGRWSHSSSRQTCWLTLTFFGRATSFPRPLQVKVTQHCAVCCTLERGSLPYHWYTRPSLLHVTSNIASFDQSSLPKERYFMQKGTLQCLCALHRCLFLGACWCNLTLAHDVTWYTWKSPQTIQGCSPSEILLVFVMFKALQEVFFERPDLGFWDGVSSPPPS